MEFSSAFVIVVGVASAGTVVTVDDTGSISDAVAGVEVVVSDGDGNSSFNGGGGVGRDVGVSNNVASVSLFLDGVVVGVVGGVEVETGVHCVVVGGADGDVGVDGAVVKGVDGVGIERFIVACLGCCGGGCLNAGGTGRFFGGTARASRLISGPCKKKIEKNLR